MKLILLLALAAGASAQTLVTITSPSDFRDAQLHTLTGSCVATPVAVTAPPLFVVPATFNFSVVKGAYTTQVLPGTYTVSCSVAYGAQRISVGLNWLVPTGGPYTLTQVTTTTPSGQQFTVLSQQMAPGGSLGDVLTRDASQLTGAKWAAPTGGGGGGSGGVTWNGSSVTWP